MMQDKFILDACCGPKEMWIDKHHPNTIYIDIRKQNVKLIVQKLQYQKRIKVEPDIIMDFRNLKFPDNTFHLVVMDPPHMINPGKGIYREKYSGLNADTWKDDLKKGLKECMRVLKPHGVLIFKWNDAQISFQEMIKIMPFKPLFFNMMGGTAVKKGKSRTAWFCFMKIPQKPFNRAGIIKSK